jgi:predicted ester cyclase
MSTLAIEGKQLIQDYFQALSGQPKTEELLDRFISDPSLKEHIRQAEAAFPGYELVADQIVADGDLVAVRGTVHAVHKGVFAGIEPTGRKVSFGLMIFYRISDARIAEHWLLMDTPVLMAQLTA